MMMGTSCLSIPLPISGWTRWHWERLESFPSVSKCCDTSVQPIVSVDWFSILEVTMTTQLPQLFADCGRGSNVPSLLQHYEGAQWMPYCHSSQEIGKTMALTAALSITGLHIVSYGIKFGTWSRYIPLVVSAVFSYNYW